MPRSHGFTLIEMLIATAVLSIFIAAVFLILQTSSQSLGEARVRSMAIQLAQDQLELSRNLNYDRIGTVAGIPPGDLIQNQQIDKLGTRFSVQTSVLYIDDPFDGLAPTDLLPTDYKRVRISVSWSGVFKSKAPVVLMTDISPQGLESADNSGTVVVMVFDALGEPVTNALVKIQATSLSPPVQMETYTDINGQIIIPGAPVCTNCYQVQVTKDGYTTDRTYSNEEITNPISPHLSVLEAKVTNVSFSIDRTSSLTVKTTRSRLSGYSPFVGVNLIITGTKEIGRTDEDEPVYKVNQTLVSGTGGIATLSNLEWDSYTISVPNNSSIDIAGTWPFNPVALAPDQALTVTVVTDTASTNSLLVQLESDTQNPLESARLELQSGGSIATTSSGMVNYGDYSQGFFKNLLPGSYGLSILAEGFETATSSVTVAGDKTEHLVINRKASP